MLADLPERSWSSCWKCGPWLRCRSWPGWGWTPPPLRLATEQPRWGCGSPGFSAMGLRGWCHTAHLDGCIALLGSTAPVAPHNSTSKQCSENLCVAVFKTAPTSDYKCTIFYPIVNVQSFFFLGNFSCLWLSSLTDEKLHCWAPALFTNTRLFWSV